MEEEIHRRKFSHVKLKYVHVAHGGVVLLPCGVVGVCVCVGEKERERMCER